MWNFMKKGAIRKGDAVSGYMAFLVRKRAVMSRSRKVRLISRMVSSCFFSDFRGLEIAPVFSQ